MGLVSTLSRSLWRKMSYNALCPSIVSQKVGRMITMPTVHRYNLLSLISRCMGVKRTPASVWSTIWTLRLGTLSAQLVKMLVHVRTVYSVGFVVGYMEIQALGLNS